MIGWDGWKEWIGMNGIDFNLFGKDEKGELNKAGLDIIFLERMNAKRKNWIWMCLDKRM